MTTGPAGRRLRVAFVIQRYGRDVNGGAEQYCRITAERMARYWDVDALSTCALDYVTWANHYPVGAEQLNGVTVRRFPVAVERDIDAFNRMSEDIAGHPQAPLEQQERWMRAQGPWSPELLEFIRAHREDYDLFIFFGYLYAQSYFGLRLVADKAIFIPFAHDEWPIRLSMWDAVFASPRAFIFNTPEEERFLRRRFPRARIEGPVVGVALERPEEIDPSRFRASHGIDSSFLLYVGRVDPSKGCGEMFAHFMHHVQATGDERLLVTIGRAVMELPRHPQIVHLGFVPEQTKWDAMAACDLLVMPSPFESLSMVLLETWLVQRPVLVNAACDVLLGQVQRAHGGLAYRSRDEFSSAVTLLSNGAAASVLARQGHDFTVQRYSWQEIEQHYLRVAREVAARARSSIPEEFRV